MQLAEFWDAFARRLNVAETVKELDFARVQLDKLIRFVHDQGFKPGY